MCEQVLGSLPPLDGSIESLRMFLIVCSGGCGRTTNETSGTGALVDPGDPLEIFTELVKIGEGGYGEVFRANDARDGQMVRCVC